MFLVNMEQLDQLLKYASAFGRLQGVMQAVMLDGNIDKITFQVMMNGLKSAYEAMDKQIDDYDMDRLKERARELGVAL